MSGKSRHLIRANAQPVPSPSYAPRYPDHGFALRALRTARERREFRLFMGDAGLFRMDAQREADIRMIRASWGEDEFFRTHIEVTEAPGGFVHRRVNYWHPDTDTFGPFADEVSTETDRAIELVCGAVL